MSAMAAKYERIAAQIRQQIRSGELKPGQRLAAETTLVEEHGASLPTVRQAMKVLRAEGLIDSRHGIGTYVRAPRHRVRRTNSRYQWEKDRVREPEEVRRTTGATEQDTGLVIDDLVFFAKYSIGAANEELAKIFGVPVGTTLLQRDFRTRKQGETAPFGLGRSYLVYDMVSANPDLLTDENEPWPGGTQHQLYTIGIELDDITETVTARPPTIEEQTELDINGGVSVLDIRKVSTDTAGRVVEVADVILPGDRYELVFTTKLERWA